MASPTSESGDHRTDRPNHGSGSLTIKILLTVAISAFWVAMMTRLIRHEIAPTVTALREASEGTTYQYLETLAAKPRATQMGIYLRDKRIGYALSRIQRSDDTLHIESRSELAFSLSPDAAVSLGPSDTALDVVLHFKARVLQSELLDFRLTVNSPPGSAPVAIIDGVPTGKRLHLKIRHGGETQTETIPFDSKQVISGGFTQMLTPGNLTVGMRWPIRSVDPFSRSVRVTHAEVTGIDTLRVGDRSVRAFVIRVPYGSNDMTVWADEEGNVLKQTLFGFTFLKESPPSDVFERRRL